MIDVFVLVVTVLAGLAIAGIIFGAALGWLAWKFITDK